MIHRFISPLVVVTLLLSPIITQFIVEVIKKNFVKLRVRVFNQSKWQLDSIIFTAMKVLNKTFNIQPFQPKFQAGARDLILAGLAEHWGQLDPRRNLDLDDIGSAYADAFFMVAVQQDRVIGTGALIPKADTTAEIVRMSVAADMRRRGVASAILHALYSQAHTLGVHQLVLETTETWQDVISFYEHLGFKETHRLNGDVYFKLDLEDHTDVIESQKLLRKY